MATCKECKNFYPIPEDALDYKPGKGDCVREESDDKGKYWKAKPTQGDKTDCKCFTQKV